MIKRRKARVVDVGGVKIGGGHPIAIQSMVKTKTSNIGAVIRDIISLEEAGCELIRVAVKDLSDAAALKSIKKKIKIPLIADIHYDYRLAIESIRNGADKIRINPGNIADKGHVAAIIKSAKARRVPIRIGLNSGSLPDSSRSAGHENKFAAALTSANEYIKLFERQNFRDIIISLKSSNVNDAVGAYRALAKTCDYPLHLGVTAAGAYDTGIIKSSIGIGSLLLDGIGDTIRVSLTGSPIAEVIAAKRILQTCGIRYFNPEVISCPTCGRCQVDLAKIVDKLEYKLSTMDRGLWTNSPLSIAVMGCEVNGPGEAKEADIGVAFGKDAGVLFVEGKIIKKIKKSETIQEIVNILLKKVLKTKC